MSVSETALALVNSMSLPPGEGSEVVDEEVGEGEEGGERRRCCRVRTKMITVNRRRGREGHEFRANRKERTRRRGEDRPSATPR